MDKEDILLKSRNDNRKGDEREVQNRTNAELFSYGIVVVILFVTALLANAVNSARNSISHGKSGSSFSACLLPAGL